MWSLLEIRLIRLLMEIYMYKKWANKETLFLKENYSKLTIEEIARKLNRSEESIHCKAFYLGLRKTRGYPPKELPSSAYKPSEGLAWIVGYLLGDGYLTTCWTIGAKTKDNDLGKFYIKKFNEWSGFNNNKFLVHREERKYNDIDKGKVYTCEKVIVIRVCSKVAWQFLKKFKEDPLYSLEFFPKKYWKSILKGLWDAEGNITPYKGDNRIVIGFANSNEKLLKLYETICLSLGFHPRLTRRDREKSFNICSLAEVLDFVDKIKITIARKRKKVMNRINKLRKKAEIYRKVIRLRKEGLKRKQILEKLNGSLSPGTFDNWVYSGRKPYYIENAKAK